MEFYNNIADMYQKTVDHIRENNLHDVFEKGFRHVIEMGSALAGELVTLSKNIIMKTLNQKVIRKVLLVGISIKKA